MGLLGWALIQSDLCPYKFRHTEITGVRASVQKKEGVRTQREGGHLKRGLRKKTNTILSTP